MSMELMHIAEGAGLGLVLAGAADLFLGMGQNLTNYLNSTAQSHLVEAQADYHAAENNRVASTNPGYGESLRNRNQAISNLNAAHSHAEVHQNGANSMRNMRIRIAALCTVAGALGGALSPMAVPVVQKIFKI